ncbi:response regulator [Asticcacaulis sp. BYS171W]|uniref:Response regulator n=1 Tax=Asticcacaulis aquaticus TaxID=2984212 RepID=A0ABT5HU98_9CAUL|nr:response regulator [Asticcacaulis aquaticus]MDC7683528.1 response regulator [Asticcacaulis aquaticus]
MTKTVLILEDSRTQATIIGKLFERAGYTPTVALDRSAALAHLRSDLWSLLVLDVFIAGENTLEHLDAYRKLAPDTPIAVMTAGNRENPLAASQALNAARRARVQFLLPKPFNFDDIQQICAEADALNGPRDALYL